MSARPVWKLLGATDQDAIFIDETGQYPPEMEVAQDVNDSAAEDGKWELFRFPLEQLKRVEVTDDGGTRVYLVPIAYEESWPHPVSVYEEWFVSDLGVIAASCGWEREELVAMLLSDKPQELAGAYQAIGGYHGFINLDGYPVTLTTEKLNSRW